MVGREQSASGLAVNRDGSAVDGGGDDAVRTHGLPRRAELHTHALTHSRTHAREADNIKANRLLSFVPDVAGWASKARRWQWPRWLRRCCSLCLQSLGRRPARFLRESCSPLFRLVTAPGSTQPSSPKSKMARISSCARISQAVRTHRKCPPLALLALLT